MEVEERFLSAVRDIEGRLFEPLALADVASRAGWSPTYFSRLFRVFTGEPFSSYVRRRRLTCAADRLRAEGASIRLVELALDCGYDSQEAFTRAFKRAFGATPGAFRRRPRVEGPRFRRPFGAASLAHLTEVLRTEPEIREIDAFVVAGLRRRFDSGTKSAIPRLWAKLGESVPRIAHRTRGRAYGVTTSHDVDAALFEYLAGVEVDGADRLPPEIVAQRVPRQTYAVFRHLRGSGSLHRALQPTLRWIWGTWLPASAFEWVPGPELERYTRDLEPAIEVCIPVRPKACDSAR